MCIRDSAYTLGSAVTGSSLTSVGTLNSLTTSGDIFLANTQYVRFGTSDSAWITGQDGASGYLKLGVNSEQVRVARSGVVSVFGTLAVGTTGVQSSGVASFVGGTQNQVNIADGSNSSWGLLLTQSQAGGGYHTSTNSPAVAKPCAIVNVQNDALNFGTNNTMRWTIDHDGHFYPGGDGNLDIGKPTQRARNVYSADVHLNNTGMGGNEVDGSEGHWTMQEGADDLFLINRITGKKYKFNLTEV